MGLENLCIIKTWPISSLVRLEPEDPEEMEHENVSLGFDY